MPTYRVNIREVHISTREVEAKDGTSDQEIIQMALEDDNETHFEYSHTLDSENHTVEVVE